MISKSDNARYWSTGITVNRRDKGWGADAEFYDDGFCDDNADAGQVSTQGKLNTRYYVADGNEVTGLRAAIDAVKADAERLGIEFRPVAEAPPSLYYKGDGEWADYPPPGGWRDMLVAEAERLGWTVGF